MNSNEVPLPPAVRVHLHDAAGHMSLAVLQLGVVLERETLDPELRDSLADALGACQDAASALRQIWRIADGQG